MYYPQGYVISEKAWASWEKRINKNPYNIWENAPDRSLALCCGAKYLWPSESLDENYVGFQISENNLFPEYDTGKQKHVAVKTKAGILNVVSHYD